jgi:hypothetical protein
MQTATEQKPEEQKSEIQKLLEMYTQFPLERVSSEDLQPGDLFFLEGDNHMYPSNDISLHIVTKKDGDFIKSRAILGMTIVSSPYGQTLILGNIETFSKVYNAYFGKNSSQGAYRVPMKVLTQPSEVKVGK